MKVLHQYELSIRANDTASEKFGRFGKNGKRSKPRKV